MNAWEYLREVKAHATNVNAGIAPIEIFVSGSVYEKLVEQQLEIDLSYGEAPSNKRLTHVLGMKLRRIPDAVLAPGVACFVLEDDWARIGMGDPT